MDTAPRILQVLGSLNIGGTEIYTVNTYRNIDKNNIQFDFLIYTDGHHDYFEDEVKQLGAKVIHIPIINNKLFCIKKLYKNFLFFRSCSYQIVHINSCSFIDILLVSIPAKICNISCIIAHAHSPGIPKNSMADSFLRFLLKKLVYLTCTDYFACSNTAAEGKFLKKTIENNIHYIHNAINLEKFSFCDVNRENIRRKFNIGDDIILIGLVGRMEDEKNHKFALEIMNELSNNSNYRMIFIGDGTLYDDIQKSVNHYKLNDVVFFTGNINNVNVYYSAIDLLILPSKYEGFPFVVVEAQANGIPVFISNHVTEDCLLLEQSKHISIDGGVDEWVKNISLFNKNGDRKKALEILKRKGYEIQDEVKILEKFYQERAILNEKNAG